MQLPTSELLEFWLRPPPVERIPHVAANFLAEGYSSPGLVACAAIFSTDHPQEVRAAFEAALVELGSSWTNREGAVVHAIGVQARKLMLEGVTPADVVAEVWSLYHVDDYFYSERTPELRFWYECWISDTEPVSLNLERLQAIALELIDSSGSVF